MESRCFISSSLVLTENQTHNHTYGLTKCTFLPLWAPGSDSRSWGKKTDQSEVREANHHLCYHPRWWPINVQSYSVLSSPVSYLPWLLFLQGVQVYRPVLGFLSDQQDQDLQEHPCCLEISFHKFSHVFLHQLFLCSWSGVFLGAGPH